MTSFVNHHHHHHRYLFSVTFYLAMCHVYIVRPALHAVHRLDQNSEAMYVFLIFRLFCVRRRYETTLCTVYCVLVQFVLCT